MGKVHCPYCASEIEINHEDGYGYEEDVLYHQECDKCKKNFVFTTHIHFSYDLSKADCLNGGEHTWERTHTFPVIFTKMRCTQCGEERKPTLEEKKIILGNEEKLGIEPES